MSCQFLPAIYRFETEFVSGLAQQLGRRPSSAEAYIRLIGIINEGVQKGEPTAALLSAIRLAIKTNPYSPEVPQLLKFRSQITKAIGAAQMGELVALVRASRERELPLPLIASCERYLPNAKVLHAKLQERYFSLPPLILRGDASLSEPRYESFVLSLPVADTYEALPTKMFEAYSFLQSLDEACGIIKIDDDLTLSPHAPMDMRQIAGFFASAAYIGNSIYETGHDRLWHFGKCSQPVPVVYGKPLKAPWARGALYYLSAQALERLSSHYLRFPGCLAGELYEDKAVGNVLYDQGVLLSAHRLENLLGLGSESPERA